MNRLSRGIVRLRFLVVAFWIAATVAAVTYLPTIEQAGGGEIGSLVPDEAKAIRAERLSKTLFAFPLLSRTVVVVRAPQGLSDKAQQELFELARSVTRGGDPALRGLAAAAPLTDRILERGPTATTAINYLFFPPGVSRGRQLALAQRYARRIEQRFDAQVAAVTGTVPAALTRGEVIFANLHKVELATIILVALVVALHFRSLVTPLITLGAVAVAYLISVRGLGWLGQRFGLAVPSEVQPVIVVLLFGIVTDYTIFFVSRFRDRLSEGQPDRAAAERGTGDVLAIVLVAGVTIAATTLCLLAADLDFFQVFGPGLAAAVALSLVVVITLIPAALAILGHWALWPGAPRPSAQARVGRRGGGTAGSASEHPRRPSRRERVIASAIRRPGWTAVACLVLLLAGASGLVRLEIANPMIRGLPDDAPAAVAYAAASKGFPTAGYVLPTVAVVRGPAVARSPQALDRLQAELERQPGVAAVFGPGTRPGAQARGIAVSERADAARLLIAFDDDPLGGRAVNTLDRLVRRTPQLLREAGLDQAKMAFAGDTALTATTVRRAIEDLYVVGPLALLALFAVLALYLRALVAPLYLVAASVLGVACAFGSTAWLVGPLFDVASLSFIVPFAVAVLLIALGSDYNVFLVGRIWEEGRHRPVREAVRVGSASAAGPIDVAGFILAASFAALALVPLTSFRTIAFAMAAGIAIDVILVRTLLVPALISLVGPLSGWPGRRLGSRSPEPLSEWPTSGPPVPTLVHPPVPRARRRGRRSG